MKCDELKVYVPQDGPWGLEPEEGGKLVEEETCYLKSEVDSAIAELKEKLHDAEMAKDLAEAANTEYREDIKKLKEELVLGMEAYTRARNEKMAMFDELSKVKFENERLKRCEIWMKQHFFCEEVIACESAKNRRLRMALWLARAERAKDRAMTCNDFAYLGDTSREINMTLARTWMKCRMLKPSEWSKVWNNVERKCLKKAEEYK